MARPLLQALPPLPCESLLPPDIVAMGNRLRIPRNTPMPETPGKEISSLYYIRSGLLRTFRTSSGGERKTLHLIGPGYFIYESYFFSRVPLQIDCNVVRDVTLTCFPRASASLLMRQSPVFAHRLLCSVALKMHLMGSDLVSIAYESPMVRLRLCIASLANAAGAGIESPVDIEVSQMELAELIGIHRVSTGRLLQQMQKERLLEIHRNRLRLLPAFFQDEVLRRWNSLSLAPAEPPLY